jgi:hypothetical protein
MNMLLTWCAPWLVAMPLHQVRRIAMVEQAPRGGSGSAWLGQVAGLDNAGTLPAWDVAGLLGVAAPIAAGDEAPGSWVIIEQPLLAAVRVGRCLQVLTVAETFAIPPFIGGPAGVRGFATAGLRSGLPVQPDFGLVLDVREWWVATTLGGAACGSS